MIKTVVIPKENTLQISIPNNYIGKEIEVLLYAKDELIEGKTVTSHNISRFKGLLSNEEADNFDKHLRKARNEWERDI